MPCNIGKMEQKGIVKEIINRKKCGGRMTERKRKDRDSFNDVL